MPHPQAESANPPSPGISTDSGSAPAIRYRTARSRLRGLVLLAASLAIFTKLVLLSPRPLDRLLNPEEEGLLDADSYFESTGKETRIAGIPRDSIPDYVIDGFAYTATESNRRLWRVISSKAFLYDELHLAHLKRSDAQIFNSRGEITLVSSAEAKYDTVSKEIEFHGNVTVEFPSGYVVRTSLARFLPKEERIEVPIGERVIGEGSKEAARSSRDSILDFSSSGLRYFPQDEKLVLPSQVRVLLRERRPRDPRRPQETEIEADRSVIDRAAEAAEFTMYASRKPGDRFVRIVETRTYARSRQARLNFGRKSAAIHYLVLREDVLVKEREQSERAGKGAQGDSERSHPQDLRYATSGLAEFDVDRDQVTFTVFPQFYQGADTVTGEKIILHRATDVVEIEQGNAYSTGRWKGSR